MVDTAKYDVVIAESQHLYDNKALQLSERFFDIEDTSLLKVGSFGYATALNSYNMRNGTFHRNMLHNEFFLSASKLNSTVYNWAKILDYDVELASPSMMPVAFKISIEQLEKISSVSTSNGNNREFVISRNTIFDVGGFNFMLPYDMRITLMRSGTGQTSVSALYDFEAYNIRPATIRTPYLKTSLASESGVTYVIIAMQIYQMIKAEWNYTIASNDILDVGIIEQHYGSGIVDFRAMYSANENNVDNYTNLEMIFNEIRTPSTDKYGYYTYVGDDTLRVHFSSRPGEFRPAFNSKVKLEIFTTSAESGNFNYSGTINIRDPRLEGLRYSCLPLTDSAVGGGSQKTFRETKIALMQRIRTRDSITTSYDLQTYFDDLKRTQMSTQSEFTAVKLRDDIIRRQLSMFILPRTSTGAVIPTNTVALELTMEELSSLDYSLRPGTLIVYDRIERRYRLLDDSELPEAYLSSRDSYLYAVPFLMNVDFKEFPKVNTYFTTYSKTSNLVYSYLNLESPYEIILNTFTVERDPLTDIDFFRLLTYVNTNSLEVENVKLRAILYKDGNAVGYADMSKLEGTADFELRVNAPDSFDKDGNYLIQDTFYDIDSGQLINEIKLDGSYSIQIGVLVVDEDNAQEKSGIFARMSDIDNYVLVSILNGEDNVEFALNLSNIMYSEVEYNEFTAKMRLSHVPLVGAMAYLNREVNTEVMNDLYSSLEVAKMAASNLENNTTIDVKFYNTYGVSRYFDIDTIDLRLQLTIAMNTTANRTIEEEIKTFVAEYVESCNNTEEKRFSISNLMKNLENNFSYIKYIKFFNVNGGNIQSVRQISYLGSSLDELPIDYVPEYLSVRKTLPKSSTDSWYDVSVNVTYEQ